MTMQIHIGSTNASSERASNSWQAYASTVVHNADHNPINDISVTGYWRMEVPIDGGEGFIVKNSPPETAKTRAGYSSHVYNGISDDISSALFMIINLEGESYIYRPELNDIPPSAEALRP